ncbi:MAG: phosphoribosylformylglycinamidine cyclo-ligase [Chthonomonadales bacterium]|nr:phosphoribosylformylglycinamidine cyclo-ligase [Chthonomonadales bacterium]
MPDQPMMYREAGVDIDAMNAAVLGMREHVRSTFTPGVLTDLGSFGGIFAPDWRAYDDPVLVSSIDGVGTKVKVAAAVNRHSTVGMDLLNHCANDILVQGARPLFFLDYFATGRLSPAVAVQVVEGLSEACRAVGCALIGGETAELPGIYNEGDYDLAGCIVGIVDRQRVVDGRDVEPGDAVIGLASDGLHTNGYSLARRVLLEIGGLAPEDRPPALGGETLADVLLRPHRCYTNAVLPLLDAVRVKAMAHITGGGFYENIPRSLPPDCSVTVDRRDWTIPPIYRLIQEIGSVPDPEMFRTFNMGIGYVLVVQREAAMEAVERLSAAGENASLIGEVYRGVHEVDVL